MTTKMRTIKFRAKTTANGHWVYDSLMTRYDGCVSIRNSKSEPWVVPSTVGQFTGLTDCNGKEIYEGDIVRYGHILNVVRFKHGMFGYEIDNGGWFVGYGANTNFRFQPFNTDSRHEIIGNIHDNPELRKIISSNFKQSSNEESMD